MLSDEQFSQTLPCKELDLNDDPVFLKKKLGEIVFAYNQLKQKFDEVSNDQYQTKYGTSKEGNLFSPNSFSSNSLSNHQKKISSQDTNSEEILRLKAENARLKTILERISLKIIDTSTDGSESLLLRAGGHTSCLKVGGQITEETIKIIKIFANVLEIEPPQLNSKTKSEITMTKIFSNPKIQEQQINEIKERSENIFSQLHQMNDEVAHINEEIANCVRSLSFSDEKKKIDD